METTEQLNFLLRRRCHEAQGYYFGRPVPMEMVGEMARTIERRQQQGEGARAIA